jgi:hypothetical protein
MYSEKMRCAIDEWFALPRAWQAAQTLSDFRSSRHECGCVHGDRGFVRG